MRSRHEAAVYAENLMENGSKRKNSIKHPPFHFGRCEIRDLFDFIYGGIPLRKEEEVFEPLKLRNSKVGKWRE